MPGVTVMSLDIVTAGSGHVITPMAPCVCITPGVVAGAPGPLPYPVTCVTGDLSPGTKKTKAGGKKILTFNGKVAKILKGNQPGSQKDITTGQTGGASWMMGPPAINALCEDGPFGVTGCPGFTDSA